MDKQSFPTKYPHQFQQQPQFESPTVMPVTVGVLHFNGPAYTIGTPITVGVMPTSEVPIDGGHVYAGGIPLSDNRPAAGENYLVNHKRGYCEETQRNQPQYNSIFAGILMLIISGMHIGWTIWRFNFFIMHDGWWWIRANQNALIFTLTSWFVMAIVGSMVGSQIMSLTKEKKIYWGCAICMALSSLIILIWDDQIGSIIVARLLAGFAHGVVYVVLLAHAAENAEQNNRGYLLSSLNLSLMIGAFLFAILHFSVATAAININRLIGIIGLVLSAFAAISATFLTYESVPNLLRTGNETIALRNMMRLRTESVTTTKVRQDFEEMKLMVSQDKMEGQNIFIEGNGRPLLLMTAIKAMAFCCNNWILNIIQIRLVSLALFPTSGLLGPLILTSVRMCMSFVMVFVVDLIPRKFMLAISGAATSVVLVVIGILAAAVISRSGSVAFLVFCILLQLTVAFGIDPLQHILLAEAFSMAKKTWSFTCVLVLEHSLQILTLIIFGNIHLTTGVMVAIPFVAAALIAVITPILYFALPETIGLSLRKTRDEYNIEKHRTMVYSRENNNFQVA